MKTELPQPSIPNLARRLLELEILRLPDARYEYVGRELHFRAGLSPGQFGRVYDCLLKIKPDAQDPEITVIAPDLKELAGGRKIPHIYPSDGLGTNLCLWWPKGRDWRPTMRLTDTFIPWTAEWLHYFELWLLTDEWLGGGEHPTRTTARRWSRQGT
jgi:hypothetical protein